MIELLRLVNHFAKLLFWTELNDTSFRPITFFCNKQQPGCLIRKDNESLIVLSLAFLAKCFLRGKFYVYYKNNQPDQLDELIETYFECFVKNS